MSPFWGFKPIAFLAMMELHLRDHALRDIDLRFQALNAGV